MSPPEPQEDDDVVAALIDCGAELRAALFDHIERHAQAVPRRMGSDDP